MSTKGRPGPGGTRIYPRKPRGRTRGVPATKAEAAAARVAALKHGGRATVVSIQEARGLAVEKVFGEGAREVLDSYHSAINDGDSSGVDALAVRGLTDLEMIRRGLVARVAKDGVVVKEAIVSPLGEIMGSRLRQHPGVESALKYSEALGHTSSARRLDPKSRGEGHRDEALAAMLRRDAVLRGMPKDLMAPPPPDDDDVVDSEVVPSLPAGPAE
jgi:hypothetical protein